MKDIKFSSAAWRFYLGLPEKVQSEFNAAITILEETGMLTMPSGRKLDENLFEIRVRVSPNQYRMIYCYIGETDIHILTGFQKKSQKTPLAEIKKAKKVRKAVLNG